MISCGDEGSSIVEEKTFTAGQRMALDSLSGQWSANKVTWSITIVDTVSFVDIKGCLTVSMIIVRLICMIMSSSMVIVWNFLL